MKSVLCLLAAVLSTTHVLDAQHAAGVPVVNADGPTVIAFFPNASKITPDDPDGIEALSDFELYAKLAKKPLNQLGIQFAEEFGSSFRVCSGPKSALFTRNEGTPGYYFFAHDKKPRIVIGVRTDSDLLALARQYFGLTAEKK